MINKLLILGGHIQALGLARQAKQRQVKVFLVIQDKYSVTRFSLYVDEVSICHDNEELLQCLRAQASSETMLFPTSDEYIAFIIQHYDLLNSLFTLALPQLSIVELFANKTLAYQFAEENRIPHPWSRYPQSLSEVESMSGSLEYPVIIKPSVMYSFHKRFGKKAFLCHDKKDLLGKIKELVMADYPIQSLIIQEFLSGGAKQLYSFGFFAVNGVVKSSILVNRIRQNPMDFGNSTTYAITTDIPEIEEQSRHLIAITRYSGMGEIEFMFDKGEYKFLEINTRAWKWHSITMGKGFSFIGDWIDWLNGKNLSARDNSLETVAWVERLTDFAVIAKGLFRRQFSVLEVFHSYCIPKVNAVWSRKDPLPALMYFLLSPVLFVKRH